MVENPELLSEEEWTLLIIYQAPDYKLNSGKIFAQASQYREKYPNARIYKSQKSFFTAYNQLTKQGLLESVKVDIFNPNTRKFRKYPGYGLTYLGQKTILQKINPIDQLYIQKLNQFAAQKFHSLNQKIGLYFDRIDFDPSVRDEIIEETLIFLSMVDFPFFIDLYEKTISSRSKREELFFMVAIFFTIHLSDNISWLLAEKVQIPTSMISAQNLSKFLQVEHHIIAGHINEISKKIGLYTYYGKIQTNEDNLTSNYEFLDVTIYFRSHDPELVYMKSIIQKKATKLFIHGSKRTEFLSLAVFIEQVYQDIIDFSAIDPIFTGTDYEPGEYPGLPSAQWSLHGNKQYNIQKNKESKNLTKETFKKFLETLMKSILQSYPYSRNSNIFEIPTHIFWQLGIYPQSNLGKTHDFYLQFLEAIQYREENDFRKAEPIFIKYWKIVQEDWKYDILWYLIDCFRALNNYLAIPALFEEYFDETYEDSIPDINEFIPYLDALIDLEEYQKLYEECEKYLWKEIPLKYQAKFKLDLQKINYSTIVDMIINENFLERIGSKYWQLELYEILNEIRKKVIEAKCHQNILEFTRERNFFFSRRLTFLYITKPTSPPIQINGLLTAASLSVPKYYLSLILHYLALHKVIPNDEDQFLEVKNALDIFFSNINSPTIIKSLNQFLITIRELILQKDYYQIAGVYLMKYYLSVENKVEAKLFYSQFLAKYKTTPISRKIRVQFEEFGKELNL